MKVRKATLVKMIQHLQTMTGPSVEIELVEVGGRDGYLKVDLPGGLLELVEEHPANINKDLFLQEKVSSSDGDWSDIQTTRRKNL